MATSIINNTKVKSSEEIWGTSITFTIPDNARHALVCVYVSLFVVWLGGTTDINVIGILSNGQIGYVAAPRQVTLDGNTFVRNGNTVTISRTDLAAFRAFY